MFRNELPGACFQNTLVRFRAYTGVLPEYALCVFRAYLHNGRFQKIAKWTTNIAHLGAQRFAEIEVPLPSLAEQEQIVAEVERRLSVLNFLEMSITAGLQRAERLRQSILTEAFAGRLVPQDPNDEPAGILLDRIRAGRGKEGNGSVRPRAARQRLRQYSLPLGSD
jgi:type I restriction enzyme S subunit